ncbi:MAG: CsgG/HfaB family protein [Verrucomicrobiales bacterium]|jgi:hypothetical protein|nr:CsgG/HfaB family protein [Verrucomicrobiales bacterium]
MKKLFLTLLFAAGTLSAALTNEPLTVAVFDFQTADPQLGKRGAEVAVLLSARLSAAAGIILVERQEIDKVLGEQEIGLTGTVAPDSAAKLGALLGAKVLVTGRLFDSGGKLYLVAKIISAETARVYGEMTTAKDAASLDHAAAELADRIAALINKQAATLTVKPDAPCIRLERLKQLLAGKTLPTVSVNISEHHLNRQVPDPAAQTEFICTLQALVFNVSFNSPLTITSGTNRIAFYHPENAELAVNGEAFSEFAMRRGNLVACRARVEITVTERATGKLLLTDRETAAATDLAESVAAKQALENAVGKLLDRIIPLMVK